MKSDRRQHLTILAAFIFSALLLWLAVRGVSWNDFIETLSGIKPGYLALAISVAILNLFIRGIRWGILLRAEKPIHPSITFWAAAVGYLGNNLLPARIGDILRSLLLGRKVGIAGMTVLATTVTERILDVIALIIIGSAMLLKVENLPGWMPVTLKYMAILGFAGLGILLFLPYLKHRLYHLIGLLHLPPAWDSRLHQFLDQFIQGARSFTNPGRMACFLGLTGLIWLLDGFGTTLSARSLSLSLSLPEALLLLVALGLSSALPSTPGYIGIYQFVAVSLLPVFGFTRSQAFAYITFCQAINMLVMAPLGLIGLWYLGWSKSDSLLRPDLANNDPHALENEY